MDGTVLGFFLLAAFLGAVTTGTRWQFLRLDGDDVAIELHEYSLERDVAQILGILASSLS